MYLNGTAVVAHTLCSGGIGNPSNFINMLPLLKQATQFSKKPGIFAPLYAQAIIPDECKWCVPISKLPMQVGGNQYVEF